MTYSFLGPDPVDAQVDAMLGHLAAGGVPDGAESAQVDVKEEAGRRGRGGVLLPGSAQNEAAARQLAGEMACMANTPGGGALIVGFADDGEPIGTELSPDWLRHRIYELTGRALTVEVREARVNGTRVLVLRSHQAIDPIRVDGRLRWRVGDACVDIDPTTWHAGRILLSGIDWSAQLSGHTLADVNPTAVSIAHRYLLAAGDGRAAELVEVSQEDLLRRLNVVNGEGRLTNAGSLLFVGTPTVGIDYIRRDVPGGDSTLRIRGDQPLLEQIWMVDQAAMASNRIVHVPTGLAHGQFRVLPERAIREVIVNGVVHRDWLSTEPTLVEHIADTVVVTSPGGFVGGVGPGNIITHPSVPRYRSLAEAVASVRIAEREGVGIDRIVRDMLAIGRPMPEIVEIPGPFVRVGLIGGDPDREMLDFLARLRPRIAVDSVDLLLMVQTASQSGFIDVAAAVPVVQRPWAEAAAAIDHAMTATIDGDPLFVPVAGVPSAHDPAWRLGDAAAGVLSSRMDRVRSAENRPDLVMAWARHRGRVSSSELADIGGVSVQTASAALRHMADAGALIPAGTQRTGRGFHYRPGPGDERDIDEI